MKQYLSTKYSEGSWNFGLLILRLAAGGLMMIHGFDKLTHFANIKGMNQVFGSPTDAALVVFAEFFCAALLVLGLFTRFAAIPLIVTMAVAFFKAHGGKLTGEGNGEMALIYLCCYVAILFTGPGKYSADRAIAK
ncbi:MAG: DoxX family protein [Dinghuibacter sp.]|nr:DoxX family protein [Dinghuibacter sp.]